MVRTLILALFATLIISCDKQDNNMITPDTIEIASVQEPQTMGILEQLTKDIKSRGSGKSSSDPYTTSCIDDRTNLVISGPITDANSFVNGIDRLDLDLFTFEGKKYIVIRSENDLPYGLPDYYQRMWYINEGGSLGVYTSAGKQASIEGDWNFLFEPSLHILYEIDDNFNVLRSDLQLSTVNIDCDGYSGWYGIPAADINWNLGTNGEYNTSQEIDSVFIKLNTAGEYVAGGYLYEDSFYLENYFSKSINTRCSNSVQVTSELPVGEYITSWGSYENNGITYYNYCLEEENDYELLGYQLRTNGSTINFIWYPHGLSNTNYIAEMTLTKTDRAPNTEAYRAASAAFNSVSFVERYGNWFRKTDVISQEAVNLPEYFYVDETSFKYYNDYLECYEEITPTLSRSHSGSSISHYVGGDNNERFSFNTRTHGPESTIINPIPVMNHYRNNDPDTEENEYFYREASYEAIADPQLTVCEEVADEGSTPIGG